MIPTRPLVSNESLYDPALERPIRLDTPAWRAWLEHEQTTGFAYPLFDPAKGYIVGWMSVRKERRHRGTAYWVVFRRCHGTVRKVYIGRAQTVTHARLEAIASGLRADDPPPPAQP